MRRRGCTIAAVLLLTACEGADVESQLLLPTLPTELSPVSESVVVDAVGADLAADLPDVRSAALLDAVPGDDGTCGAGQAERWSEPTVDSPVVAYPGIGFTRSRTAPSAEGGTLTVVCEHDADGVLLTADELQTSRIDPAVGDDHITRVGAAAGRVDVGIPTDAVLAVQRFEEWTLLVPLDPGMRILRVHALRGGSDREGYQVGTVTFFDADGRDVGP